MEALMQADPRFWQGHYQGTEAELAYLRRHAYSDRIRYYWALPEAEAACRQLIANLRQFPPSLSVIGDHLPGFDDRMRSGVLANDPEAIVLARIAMVAKTYARACGAGGSR
jgi:D-tagatose-1,6-bisphosphate aldolase subunit GatZ/KbaZ